MDKQQASSGSALWLIDGFNLLHACILDGHDRGEWWQVERRREVMAFVEVFAGTSDVCVIFDGATDGAETPPPGSAAMQFAADADRAIIARCRDEAPRRDVCVVTADRSLQDRCRALGARIVRPWDFAELVAGPSAASRVEPQPEQGGLGALAGRSRR